MSSGRVIWRGNPSYKSKFMGAMIGRTMLAALIFCGVLYGLRVFARRPGDSPVEMMAGPLGLLAIAAAFGACIGILHLVRRSYVYTLTTHEASVKSGILNLRTKSAPYGRIQTMDMNWMWYERLILKTGDVVFATAATDSDMDDVVFRGVDNPRRIIGLANQAQYGDLPDTRPSSSFGPAAPSAPSYSTRPPGYGDGMSNPPGGEQPGRPSPPGLPPR